MKIIYIKEKYPEKRNIINIIKKDDVIYENRNVVKTIKYLFFRLVYKLVGINNWDIDGKYLYPKYEEAIIHTFNTVCFTETSWVVTFESVIPRIACTVERNWEKGDKLSKKELCKINSFLDLMLKNNCKGIIALSYSAFNIQKEFLREIEYSNIDKFMKKINVIYPPQKVVISKEDLIKKYSDLSIIHFIFIANAFFLKGGKQIIDTLEKIRRVSDFQFDLIIVSNFSHAEGYETKKLLNEYKRKCEESDWIKVYSNITNEEVIDLCKASHVGILASYQETFGYSLLEMQAAGVPVITTNIRAYPELNNDECGWVINLEKDVYGECYRLDYEAKLRNKRKIVENLYSIISDIYDNPNQLLYKAQKSIDRIKKVHSPEEYENKIWEIYCR